jgi:shikimate kinase
MNKNIFLTGFMGSGKSRIGKLLSAKLNMRFVDTDKVIEEKYHRTITQIFEEYGEEKFREIESNILTSLIEDNNNTVFALGGGSLIRNKNLKLVQESGILIYIHSDLKTIRERTKNNKKRPLLLVNGGLPTESEFFEKAEVLMEKRKPGYQAAQITINRDSKEAEEVVEEIVNELNL